MSRLTSISVAMVCALAGACGEATATAATPDAALGGGLRELVSSYEAHAPTLATQLKLHLTDGSSNPLVRIRVAPGKTPKDVMPQLKSLGFTLRTTSSLNPSQFEGYLPLGQTRAAAGVPGILALHATQRPVHMARREAGAFGTVPHQAAVLEKADLVQAQGINGSGISVGVLSDSFNTCFTCATDAAQDVAAGNLPAGGVTVIAEGPPGSSDEGRAMLQLVYDIAPGAALGFATADQGQLSFAENILALRTQFGADIIVDDTYYFAEPFYSDGTIAQAVNLVAQNGAAYFSSAGNNGLEAYEATYSPVSFAAAEALGATGKSNLKLDQIPATLRPSSLHNFKNPDGSTNVAQRITSTNLDGNRIEFQWDDNNLLTDEPNEYLFLAASPNQLVGDAYQTDYQIVIGKMNEGPAERIKYIVLNSLAPSERQNAPSMYGHAAATGAEAVAAAYYAIPGFPEEFSAQGPATILFDDLRAGCSRRAAVGRRGWGGHLVLRRQRHRRRWIPEFLRHQCGGSRCRGDRRTRAAAGRRFRLTGTPCALPEVTAGGLRDAHSHSALGGDGRGWVGLPDVEWELDAVGPGFHPVGGERRRTLGHIGGFRYDRPLAGVESGSGSFFDR